MTGGGVGTPPTGASPTGGAGVTGAVPDMPGVSPVLAGTEDPGVLGAVLAVRSWEPVALVIVVAMSAATAAVSGSGMFGIRGSPGAWCSGAWRCSVPWWACTLCPAGVVPCDDEEPVPLGVVALPDGPLPAMRLERVEFVLWGAADGVGVTGKLGDSVLGALVARGISGSWWGSTAGAPGVPVYDAATT